MGKGIFVVIEGIDASGKGIQLKLLEKKLKQSKKKVMLVDFPRYYSSSWGKMVGDLLIGKFGKFLDIDPHLAVLPFMIDEYTWSRDVGEPWLAKGNNILSDRFFTSNVHNIAKLKTFGRKKYRDWLWDAGYEELGILKPNLVIFLDVNPNITRKLIGTKEKRKYLKGKKGDQAEKNWSHQWSAYREYVYMTKKEKAWIRIKCTLGKSLLTPEEIHIRIWKVVGKRV